MHAGEAVVDERANVRDYLRAQLVALASSAVLLTFELLIASMPETFGWSFFAGIFTPAYLVIVLVVIWRRASFSRLVAAAPVMLLVITCGLAAIGTFVSALVATFIFGTVAALFVGSVLGAVYCLLPMIVSGFVGMRVYAWSRERA